MTTSSNLLISSIKKIVIRFDCKISSLIFTSKSWYSKALISKKSFNATTIANSPFKLVTELYFKQLKNLIPYEIDNVRLRYYAKNIAEGYSTGIDLKINGEFVKGVESWVSIGVMNTREDILNDFYKEFYNSDGDTIIPGYTQNDIPVDSNTFYPSFVPRPTDQRVTFGLFFQVTRQ